MSGKMTRKILACDSDDEVDITDGVLPNLPMATQPSTEPDTVAAPVIESDASVIVQHHVEPQTVANLSGECDSVITPVYPPANAVTIDTAHSGCWC